jgi:tetratricopeptide (TPR) repeat protein
MQLTPATGKTAVMQAGPEFQTHVAALLAKREFPAAITLLQAALRQQGPAPELLYHLAVAQQGSGDTPAAIDSYRHCLRLRPTFAEAHNNLGILLDRSGQVEEAASCFDAALALRPGYLRALTNLGDLLRRTARPDAAGHTLERALALAPDYPPALFNLGLVRLDQQRAADAAGLLRRVLVLQPGLRDAREALTRALLQGAEALVTPGRLTDALAAYQAIIAEYPQSAAAWNGCGVLLCRLGRHREAIASYERAIAIDPADPSPRWNLALAWLTLGELRTGWEWFEARLEVPGLQEGLPPPDLPRWDGQASLAGKSIVVHAEYGLGDTLQFCRYVKRLPALGARVFFAVPPGLRVLLATLDPAVELMSLGEPTPAADYQCPLLSLPRAFGTERHSIPAETPYLTADAARMDFWARRLPVAGRRIGIAWRGNPVADQRGLAGRAIPLGHFEALLADPAVTLVSLQKGAGIDELASVAFGERILNFGESLDAGPDAFVDSAAIMRNLDLVVTTDTSVAHLAGALGVPVWVALHTAADWRWFLGREDSPWYPRMRLFRQQQAGDWSGVFAAMAQCLPGLAAGCHQSVAIAP